MQHIRTICSSEKAGTADPESLAGWLAIVILRRCDDRCTNLSTQPKTLRYRLLHVAARITRGQRRLRLRLDRAWRWATVLAKAVARVHDLPQPAT